jgi:DNA-binding transcriptional ArsR family regulator
MVTSSRRNSSWWRELSAL